MSVVFHEESRTFSINTQNSTYQFKVGRYGHLLHLYYGRSMQGSADFLIVPVDRGFSGNPYEAGVDKTYSLDSFPQELPTNGTGDYRSPAVIIENADGTEAVDFRYTGYSIEDGKYGLSGLPAVYTEGSENAQTLRIYMEDPFTHVKAELLYGVLPEIDIITRALIIRNGGEGKIYLEKVQGAVLDFVTGDYDLITSMEGILWRESLTGRLSDTRISLYAAGGECRPISTIHLSFLQIDPPTRMPGTAGRWHLCTAEASRQNARKTSMTRQGSRWVSWMKSSDTRFRADRNSSVRK